MIAIDVPGYRNLRLSHLVLDYNGTLARDGELLVGVKHSLSELAHHLRLHIVTADTFGKAREHLSGIVCDLRVLESTEDGGAKKRYVEQLGAQETVCIGNGRNDRAMFEVAALSICVVGQEGAAPDSIAASDVVAPDIVSALESLRHPKRLIATLRA